jgi:asparagine synthase (glutamine-hydrolysing)
MLKIVLVNNSWSRYQDSEISVNLVGYIEYEGNLFITADDFTVFLGKKNLRPLELQKFLFEYLLPKSNGNFAFILKNKSNCILACDFTRNYPLYIINDASNITITDHLGGISFKKEHDPFAQEEFLLSGFVTGNRTVFKNVKDLQAGQMATVTDADIYFQRYFILKSEPFRVNTLTNIQAIQQELNILLITTFERMIKSCPKINNWIVPLSGGHDSRLIISYLHRLGCKNVICFTYGIPSSKEIEYSRLAAEAMGYKWYFVEYTAKDWEGLHQSELFDRYIKYSFNGCCLPHSQDLLALHKLKEKGVINENDVIVPGHTAFTEAENKIVKGLSTDKQALQYVFDKYYNLLKSKGKFSIFESSIQKLYDEGCQNRYSFPEYFNWQERQAKYINNSVRAYEFYEIQWRLPMWEKCMIDFWQKLNFDDRIERKILFAASEYILQETLKSIPIINKFKKPLPSRKLYTIIFPDKLIGLIVKVLNKKSIVSEGTNLIFANKASSVKEIIQPMNIYPLKIKRYFTANLIRRPYQVNVNTLMCIYTLRNEVYSDLTSNAHE